MRVAALTSAIGLAVVAGCSAPAASPAKNETGAVPTAQRAPAAPPRRELTACELVSADEMSAILGTRVAATLGERFTGQTTCQYAPASGFSPAAQLKIEWGMAEAVMAGAAIMSRVEPGTANPYAGIGDQAVLAGGNLLIRRADDVLTLSFFGVKDEAAAARRVYDAAAAKMSR